MMRKLFSMSMLTLFLGAMSCSSSPEVITLFNGKDLSNWSVWVENEKSVKAEDVFIVKDGVIHCLGTPFGYLHTKDVYDNFKLHVEWCWPVEATNSGIFLFMQPEYKIWPNAVEAQLCAGKAGDFVLLGGSDVAEFKAVEGEQRPAFPVVERKVKDNEKPVGEWNSADIICENGTITVYINDVLQNYGTKCIHASGHIALQSEGKDILFRNIYLNKIVKK